MELSKLKEEYKNKFLGKKCFLKTYGCQMNEHDSEIITGLLKELGFSSMNLRLPLDF